LHSENDSWASRRALFPCALARLATPKHNFWASRGRPVGNVETL